MPDIALLRNLSDSRTYKRSEIFSFLDKSGVFVPDNSKTWFMEKAEREGVLFRVGTDSYSRIEDIRRVYIPMYSEKAVEVISFMDENYPELEYVLFESFLLNEFINHMIAQNTIILQIEKTLCQFVFEALNDKFPGKVLYNPSSEDLGRYRTDNCIVLERVVSEFPASKENPHYLTAEKLLVDCVSDRIIKDLISSSEILNIFDGMIGSYRVDESRIKRYAKRRNSWSEIEKYIKEIKNDR